MNTQLWRLAVLAGCVSTLAFAILRATYPPPRVESREMEYDFGVVEPGTELTHRFVLRNIGGRPLRLSNITSTCSCTSAKASDSVIGPGKSTELDVVLRVGGRSGYTSARVGVESNDPNSRWTELRVVATVNPLLGVSAPVVDFGVMKFGRIGDSSRDVSILCREPEDIQISIVDWMEDTHIKATLLREASTPTLRVSVDERAPIGPLTGIVQIRLKSGKAEPIRLTVRGEVTGSVRAEPSFLALGVIDPMSITTARVNLVPVQNAREFRVRIEGLSSALKPFLTAAVDGPGPGQRHHILLTVTGNGRADIPARSRGIVRVRCVGDTEQVINIPISFHCAAGRVN